MRTARERDEFDIGGKHIPIEEIEENIDYFNNDQPKVLYCATGKRSGEAVKVIKQKFPDVTIFSLKDGLKAWQKD